MDTCIWSDALRKKRPNEQTSLKLKSLISDGQVAVLNPIRQEILSGIRDKQNFEKLKVQLRAFPNIQLGTEVYESAAQCFNICRQAGIQGSNTDFLICAAAMHFDYFIFTTDHDFINFKQKLNIKLL